MIHFHLKDFGKDLLLLPGINVINANRYMSPLWSTLKLIKPYFIHDIRKILASIRPLFYHHIYIINIVIRDCL